MAKEQWGDIDTDTIDKNHEQYKIGYSDAVANLYSPPYEDQEWFMYQAGRQDGLKQFRLERLVAGKPPLRRW